MRTLPWRPLALVALAVFLTRAPFVPPALEDYDSVNFALALDDYDPLAHQPHPPGYPVYVALARGAYALVREPSLALGLLSAFAQALAVFPVFAVFGSLAPGTLLPWTASLLLFTCPALWFNGARPMSDSVGFLFGITAQALLLRHLEGGRGLVSGSLVAGLAAGVRAQTVLLTAPLWLLALYRRGPRTKAAAAAMLAGVLWLGPLLVISGGPARYLSAFRQTMGMALDLEPLYRRFSLNLAAHAVRFVLIDPWVAAPLGGLMLGLALVGAAWAMRRQRRLLPLALLAFGPYLLAHAFLQQVEAIRYTLPYLPLLSLLAAAGIHALVAPGRSAAAQRLEVGLAALVAIVSAALTLPALGVYANVESPPEAAVDAVRSIVEGAGRMRFRGPGLFRSASGGGRRAGATPSRDQGFVLASHYTLRRYLGALPAELEVLESPPNQSVPTLRRYWIEGGTKQALFLADPRRTDLASIDPRAQRLVGRWDWPLRVDRFMPGARPARAELLQIAPPSWIAGPGWLLSLEAGRPERVARIPERLAYLRALDEPGFLLLAGAPTSATAGCMLAMDRDGEALAPVSCAAPFLSGQRLDPAGRAGYSTLRVRPQAIDTAEPAPVLMYGLDYGPRRRAGWVHGSGWFFPERDEHAQPFRWVSGTARSLIHVPEGGAVLRVEGTAPIGYVGAGGRVTLRVDGSERAQAILEQSAFALQTRLVDVPEGFHEVTIETERTFVPHELQRNGDRRVLGLRVYRFVVRHLEPRRATAPARGPAGRG